MCRHVAWVGQSRTLASVLYEPPFALVTQQWRSRLQDGRTNVDGFGVGWYESGKASPRRHRRGTPMLEDARFAIDSAGVSSHCFLAAIRDATPGDPIGDECVAPFVERKWLFSLDGYVEPRAALDQLRDRAPDVAEARAPVDSAVLFGSAVKCWSEGAMLADGLADVIARLRPVSTGPLNLLATDGNTLAATAWGQPLFVRTDSSGVCLASEPFDDSPSWFQAPDGSVATAAAGDVLIRAL